MPKIARLDLEITLQYIKSINKMLLLFKELLLFEVNCLYFFNQGSRENCLYSSIACIRGITLYIGYIACILYYDISLYCIYHCIYLGKYVLAFSYTLFWIFKTRNKCGKGNGELKMFKNILSGYRYCYFYCQSMSYIYVCI